MEQEQIYSLGSFIGQMGVSQGIKHRQHHTCKEVGKKLLVIPPFYPDNKFCYVRERFRGHSLFPLLCSPDEEYDLSKCNTRQRQINFTDPITNQLDTRVIYGELIHHHAEAWTFLLYCGYVKLNAEVLKIPKLQKSHLQNINLTYIPVRVDAYLTQKAINDNFELKIRNYTGNRNQGKQDRQILNKQRAEEALMDLTRFARLAMLIVFDLLMIHRDVRALVKSKKQFDIYFRNLKKFQETERNNWSYVQKSKYKVPVSIICDEFDKKAYYYNSIESIGINQKNLVWNDKEQATKRVLLLFQDSKFINFQLILKNISKFDFIKFNKKQICATLQQKRVLHFNKIYPRFNRLKVPEEVQKQYEQAQEKYNQKYNELHDLGRQIVDKDQYAQFCKEMIVSPGLGLLNYVSASANLDLKLRFQNQIESLRLSGIERGRLQNKVYDIQSKYTVTLDDEKIYESTDAPVYVDFLEQVSEESDKEADVKDEDANEEKNNIFNNRGENELVLHKTPPQMKSQLKPHQQQALSWMLYREGTLTRNESYINNGAKSSDASISEKSQSMTQSVKGGDKKISPLWERIVMLNGEKYYVNVFTGKIQKEFPDQKQTAGGILADEMGLGKTLMAMALIHADKVYDKTDKDRAKTLVVVPKSVLKQWQDELHKHSYPHSLVVHEYYNINSRKLNIKIQDFDVVVTTYAILGLDYIEYQLRHGQVQEVQNVQEELKPSRMQEEQVKATDDESRISLSDEDLYLDSDDDQDLNELIIKRQKKREKDRKRSRTQEPKQSKKDTKRKKSKSGKKPRNDVHNLLEIKWTRVILDEAHNIKGRQTNQNKAALLLDSLYRWCLTGTPIQNKYDDLFSLINFLRVETFSEYFWWNTFVNKESDNERDKLLKAIIQPILLRRTKQDNAGGGIILDLQQRVEKICWVELSNKERNLYTQLFHGTKYLFKKLEVQNQVNNQYVHMFQIIGKLRMLCDHSRLIFTKGMEATEDEVNDLVKNLNRFLGGENQEKKITKEFQEEIIKQIQRGEHQICQICLEEDVTVHSISICGHVYCSSCFESAVKRQSACPSCRTKLEMKDLFSYINSHEKVTESEVLSSKMQCILDETLKLKQKGEKILLFTQWISMISLIEKMYQDTNVLYLSITGKHSVTQREKIINKFAKEDAFTVLILSLKATSTGLNLTMANNVFIVDPWWNPAIEDQAVGRSHRIGQNKQVVVQRFLCKDTIEEKINILHTKKRAMSTNVIVLSEKDRKQQDIEQFRYLFE